MAGAKRRSPTSTLVTKVSIESAGSALVDLPEKPKEIWSLREAIDALKDEITLALDRGYTYPEISQMLTARGVEISASTLKYYLSSVKRQDPNAPRRRRRRTLGSSISADSLNLTTADDAGVDQSPTTASDVSEAESTAKSSPKKAAATAKRTAAKQPAATNSPTDKKPATKKPATKKSPTAKQPATKKSPTSTKAKTSTSARRKATSS